MLSERQRLILEITERRGFIRIEELALEFAVSAQTIRRDVIHLDQTGLLRRFHGGAGMPEANVRLAYRQKRKVSSSAKGRIGRATATMIADGAMVFLDVGTTVEAVAQALLDHRGLKVITNSMHAAELFADHETTEVYLAGGRVRGSDGSLVGDDTVSFLARFRVDVAVIGCSGFDTDGTIMDYDLQKVAVKQTILSCAQRAFLVTDSSKFHHRAVVRVAPPQNFSVLVTDMEPPAELRAIFRSAGVEVVLAYKQKPAGHGAVPPPPGR